uniref:Follistatin-related protein 5 n=1 Tax=Ciona savignyi TaxID=51511 RepID=H2ZG16_CIOSA
CYFKRCYLGQKCQVDERTGRAICVCKSHCKPIKKPVCGTDGLYYENHCEMHRSACVVGKDVYDARHKDCFYQRAKIILGRSEMLTEDEFISEPTTVRVNNASEITGENGQPASDQLRDESSPSSPVEAVPTDLIDDQSGSDENAGELVQPPTTDNTGGYDVKSIFRYLDLDMDGYVGSDEIYQISTLEDLDRIFPLPCSLFHVLQYGDANQDHALDIHEFTFSSFVMQSALTTDLHLPIDKRVVLETAICGGSVSLQCGIKGDPNPIWRHYGYDVQAQGNPNINIFKIFSMPPIFLTFQQVIGDQLKISEVSPKNAGNYTCHARKRPEMKQVIRLSVHSAPHVKIYPRTQHVETGSSFNVMCHVRGIPPPRITWLMNGDQLEMESGRYVIMSNNTELHINSAQESDSAAYSCLATNVAGSNEEIGAVFVEDMVETSEYANGEVAAFFIFHESGIVILDPRSCQELRRIQADEALPGLLRQNKLCQIMNSDGVRHCNWSSAVVAGSRFVYAAQPTENRVVVVDLRLERVVEVLATDPMPVELYYVASTDQLFVHCWVDGSRRMSNLQVIYAASVPGMHFAAQIQPLDGGNSIDLAVYSFFIPPESPLNTQSRYGYIVHRGRQVIYKLNLGTLLYDDATIDLSPHGCSPENMFYQPIGGLLHVTCAYQGGELPRTVTVETATEKVVETNQESDFDREFTSSDGQHVLRVYPEKQQVRLYNITSSGDLTEPIVLHTNFAVADAAFEQKPSNLRQTTVYISSQSQAEVMHLDTSTGEVGVIDGLSRPLQTSDFPWEPRSRLLVPSSWYDRHVASAGENGVDVIDAETKEVSCRLHDVTKAMAITWVDGR